MLRKKIIFSLLLLFSSEQLSPMLIVDQIPEDKGTFALGVLFCAATVSLTEFLFNQIHTHNWPRIARWYNPANYLGKLFKVCDKLVSSSSYDDLLIDAVALGHLETVAELLQYPNIDINRYSPLHNAICADNTAMVKLLLTHPHMDVNKGTTLWRAICNNNMEIIKLLFMRPDLDINGGFHLGYATHRNNVELMKLFLKHPSTILAIAKTDPLSELRLWNALTEIAQTDWKAIESLHARDQITDEEFLYHFPEEITYANTSSLLTHPCVQAIKEEDNIFFGDWDSEQKTVRHYSLSHRSFVDFCITSKGKLNNRNHDGLRPFDIVSKWYLSGENRNDEKEQLYYSLLRATPAWSCETLYEALLKRYPSQDIAQKLMESYLAVMIPKLSSDALKQKIHTLKTESNKTQSMLLSATK